jgi:alpha-2-macroglobulin-like protein
MPPPFVPGDHVVDFVDDALNGLLSPADEQYVLTHATSCPICTVALKEARLRQDALRSLPTPEVAPAMIKGVVERIEMIATGQSRRQRFVRRWTLRGVAATIGIMALVHLWFILQKPSAYDLRILGQQQLLAGTPASLRVQLTRNNTPISEAHISLALYNPHTAQSVSLASYKTDASGSGSPQFTLPDWPDGTYTLRATARADFHTESLEQSVTLKRDARLMLSTDKPVYQPGQTIHMRALALRRPDFRPVAAREALFTLTDPRGNIIFKQAGVTSAFGITSADCPLAPEITQGTYTLLCRVGTTQSTSTLEIKPYTLPKFKISLTTDKPFYASGERVRVSVQADYFFNQPVAGARVSLDTGTPIGDVAGTTDASGHATLEFVLPSRILANPAENNDARLTLTTVVVDSAHQEQSRTVPLTVTTAPIHIELVPESGRLVPGLANRIYVLTTYADGRPARTRLAVTGLAPLVTNDLGVTVFELTPQSDLLALAVQATDDAGITSSRRIELATSADSGVLPTEDYLVRTDRAIYRTGQTLAIEVLGSGQEPVFIDLLKDGQTMRTATVPLGEGHGALAIDLPPELAGTLQLNAYRFGEAGMAVHKTRVIYVQPADDLHVQVTVDQPVYRPGDTARLAFHLTDAQGRPVAGALSLVGVDEAVFSVLDRSPGLEGTFFSLDQQLLRPVYTLYPAGPELTGTDANGQRLFNQALFARAAGTTTGRDEILNRLVAQGIISPRTIQSLNTEWGQRYFRERIEAADLSPALKEVLLSPGTFSLEASTGPINRAHAEQLQRTRTSLLPVLWFAVIVVSGFTLLFVFARHVIATVLLCLLLGSCLIAICLPSLGKAREMASRSANMAEASHLAMAIESQDMEHGDTLLKGIGQSQTAFAGPHLRQYFPETLVWRPELITDDRGNASIEVPLADSITTWRLSSSAVSASGQMAAVETPLRVFQPFFVDLNLPAALTRGDEISVPAVVYNYLSTAQTVTLTLSCQDFAESLDGDTRQVALAPGEVQSVYFRIRVLKAGTFNLQLTARAGDVSDALQRPIEVLPGGQQIQFTSSGTLSNTPLDIPLNLPANTIEGSIHAQIKFYPSTFSQVLEGLDSIFQMPSGCFEQTSSTTYPNILALDYLQATRTASPQTQAKARQYIHLGYQRLLTFEIPGGGFDWFGRPAAHPTLSAYGLQEFADMAKVHDVDLALIARTRKWLLAQQQSDGTWTPGRQFYHDDPTALGDARLTTTAYIAWSVFADHSASSNAAATQRFLRSSANAARANPYTTALTVLALMTIDPNDATARDLVTSLESTRQNSPDGKLTHWSAASNRTTAFYATGNSADIETTALAALALLQSNGHTTTAHAALRWLVASKDLRGTWFSTQATVLALKALLAGTATAAGDNQEHRMTLELANQASDIVIPADQSDVLKSFDLAPGLKSGIQNLHLTNRAPADIAYQVTLTYNIPGNPPPAPQRDLDISLNYARSSLTVGENLAVVANLRNNTQQSLPMILADLPIPPGFSADTASLELLQQQGLIEKYQLTSRQIIVYVRALEPGNPLSISYTLHALIPVSIQAQPAIAYEYYKPESHVSTLPISLEINQK